MCSSDLEAVKDARLQELQALLRAQTEAFNRSVLGHVVPVLVERPGRHPGQVVGRSPWLQAVHLQAPDAAIGGMLDATLARTAPRGWRIVGAVVAAPDDVLEARIVFETGVARGQGILRLKGGAGWTLLTTIAELKGHEEKRGRTQIGRAHV